MNTEEEHVSVFEDPHVDWDTIMKSPPPPMRYVEGHDAYRVGKLEDDNPYHPGTDEHSWWACGWADAEGYDHYWEHLSRNTDEL